MKRSSLYGVLQISFLLLVSSNAVAADYYVSPSGADTNSGASPTSAWKSISRVNGAIFRAGDRILFRGGSTFSGELVFDANDAGLNLQAISGIDPGGRDYYGGPSPQGGAFDLGAHEAPAQSASQDVVLYASETRARAGGWAVTPDATAAGASGGPGAWTTHYEELWNEASVPLHSVQFELKGGTWQPESTAPGKVIFDNFRSAR